MEASQSKHTSVSLREKLTARPVLEPLLFVSLAVVYSWVIRPTHNDWLRIPFLVVIVLIPFASNLLHRDRLRDLGLRFDNLRASAREVGMATAIGAVAILAVGTLTGDPHFRDRMVQSFFVYPLWGLIQQYAMQSFTYRRLREGIAQPGLAAAAAAALFASVHWPNWPLALVTLVGGYVWCRLFERHPNLITLALSHGWLAVLLRYSWPVDWLRNLRIGPSYWEWGL
jgi:membrane protease YdiL (CAAX protease family)